ncbi:MAG: antibiotic biosynthesis monooxygenase family protein [Acidimicrobiia bacterium]
MGAAVITIFRSRLDPAYEAEYHSRAEAMTQLARSMPGFVDAKTFGAPDGERVTVVTFADEESHNAWRDHPEHRAAQRRGVEALYTEYSIQVGAVTHERHFTR